MTFKGPFQPKPFYAYMILIPPLAEYSSMQPLLEEDRLGGAGGNIFSHPSTM